MQNLLKSSKSDLLRLSITLFVISGVMAFLVALVNNITAPIIKTRNEQKVTDTLKTVMADADSFEKYTFPEQSVLASDGKTVAIDGVWVAKKDGKTVGCCVKVGPTGYGGKIETIVAVSNEGKVVDASIVSMSETSGIGTKIKNEDFLAQFIGKSGNVSAQSETVDVISGATKSSSAYIRGIDAALMVAQECIGGDTVE